MKYDLIPHLTRVTVLLSPRFVFKIYWTNKNYYISVGQYYESVGSYLNLEYKIRIDCLRQSMLCIIYKYLHDFGV